MKMLSSMAVEKRAAALSAMSLQDKAKAFAAMSPQEKADTMAILDTEVYQHNHEAPNRRSILTPTLTEGSRSGLEGDV